MEPPSKDAEERIVRLVDLIIEAIDEALLAFPNKPVRPPDHRDVLERNIRRALELKRSMSDEEVLALFHAELFDAVDERK